MTQDSLSDTDFEILSLCRTARQTPKNIAAHLGITPNYARTEISKLNQQNLIEDPGPADSSGMYVSSRLGDLLASRRDRYRQNHHDEIMRTAQRTTEIADRHNLTDTEVHATSEEMLWAAQHALSKGRGSIHLNDLRDAFNAELGTPDAVRESVAMWWLNLVETEPGKVDEHRMTARGIRVAESEAESVDDFHSGLGDVY